MNISRKYLILLLAPAALLLGAPSASAEPSIPPSEECLALADEALASFENTDDERAVWQPLVDAGCLTKNPVDASYNASEDTPECVAAKTAATEFLAPINKAMAPVAKRYQALENNFIKTLNKLSRRIEKAEKAGKKKLVRKLERASERAINRFTRTGQKIARQNSARINQYDAPVVLAYLDIVTRECLLGDFERKNRSALTVLTLWSFLN